LGKVGGSRNFGFGKKMAWAGKQALRERYGDGHHRSVAAHAERWAHFVGWARETCSIRDARQVDGATLARFGQTLAEKVRQGNASVAYAQNLLSTVNVVLEALRGDTRVRCSPSALVGQRSHVRGNPPPGIDRRAVQTCAETLRGRGHAHAAAVVELARELGLRVREASLLDARVALREAVRHGAVNITEGTKGGRGRRVDRWVPVSATALESLRRAAAVQGVGRNLVPSHLSWRQWNDHLHHVWAGVRGEHGLGKLHDLRAAYACDRYQTLAGATAPATGGSRVASSEADRAARAVIAQELGHGRVDVVAAYVGGRA